MSATSSSIYCLRHTTHHYAHRLGVAVLRLRILRLLLRTLLRLLRQHVVVRALESGFLFLEVLVHGPTHLCSLEMVRHDVCGDRCRVFGRVNCASELLLLALPNAVALVFGDESTVVDGLHALDEEGRLRTALLAVTSAVASATKHIWQSGKTLADTVVRLDIAFLRRHVGAIVVIPAVDGIDDGSVLCFELMISITSESTIESTKTCCRRSPYQRAYEGLPIH